MPKANAELDFIQFMKGLTASELGNLMAEHLHETVHNSWDGWSERDITGVRNYLRDLKMYWEGADDRKHFQERGFGGVDYYLKAEPNART